MSDPCLRGEFFQTATDVTRLFDNLQLMVPGVTTDVAAVVIWNAIEDFYMRSAYRREHVYWRLDPCETTLEFDPYSDGWRVSRFLEFRGLSRPKFVPPGTVVDLTCPTPDSQRDGEALLALKPESFETELPYDVMTTYWETLLHGALYRLYTQPGKPYSDLKAAELSARLNRSGIASARAEAQAGHLRDAVSWSFPYFATGGRANGRQGL